VMAVTDKYFPITHRGMEFTLVTRANPAWRAGEPGSDKIEWRIYSFGSHIPIQWGKSTTVQRAKTMARTFLTMKFGRD